MTKVFFLFVLLSVLLSVEIFGQISGRYTQQIGDSHNDLVSNQFNSEDVAFSLSFYKNGNYLFELDRWLSEDQVQGRILSYGSYVKNGDSLTLYDKANGYSFTITLLGKSLYFQSGFSCVKYMSMIYNDTSDEKELINFLRSYNFSDTQPKSVRKAYLEKNTSLFAVTPGRFEFGEHYFIDINLDGTYLISFAGLCFSEGSWHRESNELILFDKALHHSFFLLIGEESLISMLTPGDLIGITGYRIKK